MNFCDIVFIFFHVTEKKIPIQISRDYLKKEFDETVESNKKKYKKTPATRQHDFEWKYFSNCLKHIFTHLHSHSFSFNCQLVRIHNDTIFFIFK